MSSPVAPDEPVFHRIVIVTFGLIGCGITVGGILELPGYGWAGVLLTIVGLPWLANLACGIIPRVPLLPWFVSWALIVVPLFLLNVLGRLLGIMDLSAEGPQLHLMTLVLAAAHLGGGWGGLAGFVSLVSGLGIVLGRSIAGGTVEGFMPWFVGIPLAYIGGTEVRSSGIRAQRAASQQEALAEQAKLDERQRVAREVHDLLAHSLAVMMLHLTAARMSVRRDPAAAADALEEAENVGRTSMREIRRSVGLLRTGDTGPTDAALPSGDDLPDLIEGYRSAGVDVRHRIRLGVNGLGPASGLALYRVVQEALANAVRHAPGEPVDITVAVADGHVTAEISNPLHSTIPASGDGVGLVGMRERIEPLGGSLLVGPDGGHWRVRADFPIGGSG